MLGPSKSSVSAPCDSATVSACRSAFSEEDPVRVVPPMPTIKGLLLATADILANSGPSLLHSGRINRCRRLGVARAHLPQRHRTDIAGALPRMPPSRRSGAHAAAELSGYTALGEGHSRRRSERQNASVVA